MNPLLHKAPMDNATVKLQYIGMMEWTKKYNMDSRMWNVLAPKLKGYDYSSGGYPTFTIEGLKERNLI